MPERHAFLDAIATIDYLFTTDPRAARRAFSDALALATAEDREFLVELTEIFTRYPFETAHKRLDAMWQAQPEHRDRINACAPETDPGLHNRGLAGMFEVSLDAAEMPPMPVRNRYRPLVTYRPPSKRIDDARNDKDAIAARIHARPAAASRQQRTAVAERTRATDTLVRDYMRTDLFTDTAAVPDIDEDSPIPATPASEDHRRTCRCPIQHHYDHDDATHGWDRVYLAHVAEQYDDDLRAACGEQHQYRPNHLHHDDTRASLTDRADQLLAAAGEPDRSAPARPRQRQSPKPATRKPISETERASFAAGRTMVQVHDDARTEIPYQGNALDYDRAALVAATGWRCVSCFIQRADSDQRPLHWRNGGLVSDDGLCDLCRADGRPGIVALPHGFTLEQFVLSRCEFLAATYPKATYALLNETWHRAAPHPICRVITRFLNRHRELTATTGTRSCPITPAPRRATPTRRPGLGADQRHGRCDGCTQTTVIHTDGYCTTCRIHLGLVATHRSDLDAA